MAQDSKDKNTNEARRNTWYKVIRSHWEKDDIDQLPLNNTLSVII